MTRPTIAQISRDLDAAAWRVTYARLHRNRVRRWRIRITIAVALLAGLTAVGIAAAWAMDRRPLGATALGDVAAITGIQR